MIQLSDFDAVTFDFYGTIVNWEREILAFLEDWAGPALEGRSVSDLLELYDRLRQPIQHERPAWRYTEVLKQTLDQLALALGCDLPTCVRDRFGDIASTHQPFPDSVATIRALRERGLRIGVLSNVDNEPFQRILNAIGLEFDVVATAERVGAYKPDLAHFNAALADLRALGIEKDRVLHVAQSRFADIVPANRLGLSCVWVDRPGHVFGRSSGGAETATPTMTVPDLASVLHL
ncbi:MAG: HAD-IA family hydrolase [Pseudomonadota bacterium]